MSAIASNAEAEPGAALLEENRRLRRTLRDVVALSTLPGVWIRLPPERIASSLADVLLDSVELDLVYIRLTTSAGADAIEVVRSRRTPAPELDAVRRLAAPLLDRDATSVCDVFAAPMGGHLRATVTRFGGSDQQGVIVTASRNADFPSERDRALLGVAANQTAMVLQRRHHEARVERSEERLRAIVETTPACIKLVAADGTLLEMNAAGLAMVEADAPEAVRGRCVYELIAEADREQFRAFNARVCGGERATLEFEIVGLKGTRRRMETSAVPLQGADGAFAQLAITHDVTDRRRAAQELKLQARVLESMREGVSVADEHGCIVYTNPAEDCIFGYQRGELIGRHVTEQNIYPAEENHRIVGEVMRCLAAEGSWSGELSNRRKDGSQFTTFARITTLDLGERKYYVCVQEDVTERRRAQEALRESEERYRASFENTAIGVAHIGPDQRILWVNPGLCAMLGYGEPELVTKTVADLIDPADREAELRLAARLARGEIGAYRSEKRYRHRSGAIVWADVAVSLVRDPGGAPKYAVAVIVDITERKQAETRLGAVLDSINDHLVSYDRNWRYTYVNDRGAEVLGRPKEALLGRCIWELFPSAVGNQYYRELHQALEEQRVLRSEHYYEPFDKWFENYIYPTPDGVTVFSADVTWRKRLEEELRRRNDRLAEADRRKDEFLATLAHELRNPLASLRNTLTILKLAPSDASVAQRFQPIMERQVDQLVRLVDDLLDVSRVMRGKIELRREPVALSDIVARAIEMSEPLLQGQRHALELELPAEAIVVDGDAVRLVQIVSNLLTNAAKYTEPGGTIRVATRRDADMAVLTVHDTGIGMAPDMLPRIFDLFTQADHAINRSRGGLGVGLTLVRNLVEMHGGGIAARSPGLGLGSTFEVRLPLARADAGIARAGAAPARPPRRKVLVVDDNADAADSLVALLGLEGHEARAAHDGATALVLAAEEPPEIAFLDLGMPGLDGYELARRFRADPRLARVRLVALTGWGQESDRARTHAAGFDAHLVKPVDLQDLGRALDDPTGAGTAAEHANATPSDAAPDIATASPRATT